MMLQNSEMFSLLWDTQSSHMTELHLPILTNYLFDSNWVAGLTALLQSPHTHQLYSAMNKFEKVKYLKFCETSARNSGDTEVHKYLRAEPYLDEYKKL